MSILHLNTDFRCLYLHLATLCFNYKCCDFTENKKNNFFVTKTPWNSAEYKHTHVVRSGKEHSEETATSVSLAEYSLYSFCFSIKTLAAIFFNKSADGQVPQSSSSNQILRVTWVCGRVLGCAAASVWTRRSSVGVGGVIWAWSGSNRVSYCMILFSDGSVFFLFFSFLKNVFHVCMYICWNIYIHTSGQWHLLEEIISDELEGNGCADMRQDVWRSRGVFAGVTEKYCNFSIFPDCLANLA